MKTFCDSCTDLKEVQEYDIKGDLFYWCEECKDND
jgi:hypothetical protein